MENILISVANMSLTASFVAFFIFALRALCIKLPKSFSYALWGIVLLRLLIPFSFSSAFSVFGKISNPVGNTGNMVNQLSFLDVQSLSEISIGAADAGMNGGVVATNASSFDWMILLGVLWILGVAALLTYNGISYYRVCKNARTATLFSHQDLVQKCKKDIGLKRNVLVYQLENIQSPFVLGIFNPKVMIPSFLCNGEGEKEEDAIRHILLHEMYHLKRLDFLFKPIGFLALSLHWFNPVMWMCFHLAGKDMEMSCDEKVMSVIEKDVRGEYAGALLGLASKHNNILTGGFLAFGESNVKERIKNIMKYKKPKVWAGAVCVLLLIACGVMLLSNPNLSLNGGADGNVGDAGDGNEVKNLLVLCNGENQKTVDTIVLLGYDLQTKKLNIMSIPRDLKIGNEHSEEFGLLTNKLSVCAGQFTPEEVAAKVGTLLGITIDHYVKFDTSCFRDLVDSIGGVDFEVAMDMKYEDPNQGLSIDLKKGMQHLNGEEAEMLARFRKSYPKGDLDRIEVQKQLMMAVLSQKSNAEIIKNIGVIYDKVSPKIQTNLDKKDIKQYMEIGLKGFSENDVASIMLPVMMEFRDGISFLELDPEADLKMVQSLF